MFSIMLIYCFINWWLKNKKATVNPKNKDDKGFQYAVAVALNHEQIESHPESISKIKPFIDQYSWKEISFPSHQKDWKQFELNKKSIALNMLHATHNTKEIRHAYMWKYNTKRENQVILLMITYGEKWHYLPVKNCLHYLEELHQSMMKTFIT